MQQITLALDHDEPHRPDPNLEPERQRQIVALMAQAIVAVLQSQGGQDDESQ